MESHQNPNLENNQNNNNNHHNVLPSQDLKIAHHQHNIIVSKVMDKNDEVYSLKNASEVTKKPNSFSCSALGIEKNTTPPPMTPQDFMSIRYQQNLNVPNKPHEDDGSSSKNGYEMAKKPNSPSCSSSLEAEEKDMTTQTQASQEMVMNEESGRERLKKHRAEMAGRVWIPDIWGHEDLLKDWIDCTVFDSSLGNKNIMSARAALVQEARSTLRIQNQC